MKKIALAAAMFAALAGSAHADTFIFSYTFEQGAVVTGSFDGTITGDLVRGLSNISFSINGTDAGRELYGATFNLTSGWHSGVAVASFSGTRNNFMFTDVVARQDIISRHFFRSHALRGAEAFSAIPGNPAVSVLDFPADIARWSLTNVSAVPEPETYALMLTGLGVICAVTRRRKQKAIAA